MADIQIKAHKGAGVEILGIDLADMSDNTFEAVRSAYADHGLVFFRDQALSEEQHIDLAHRFGEINVNRFFTPNPRHPEIAMVVKEPDQKINIGGGWHTDHSYDLEPAMG
ncbi:MAG: TauD/TfdA family dioxygenase, partial [Acidiferrobacterales bacterium]|nr:TauD/TfdA family dioxygenase [Acidiferrobacterales bacterium]